MTGCRRGELLGLAWDDVDFEAGEISIRRSLVPVGYTITENPPKTESGTRTLSLPPTTMASLKHHRAVQISEKMEHRDIWGAERSENLRHLDLVFTDEIGRELHPDRISKLFAKAVTKSKLPTITLHGLRHTQATIMLIEMGTPTNVVARRLGHANASITLNIYSHASKEHDKEAAADFGALVTKHGN